MCVPLELQDAWALELKISYHLAKISKPMTILGREVLGNVVLDLTIGPAI